MESTSTGEMSMEMELATEETTMAAAANPKDDEHIDNSVVATIYDDPYLTKLIVVILFYSLATLMLHLFQDIQNGKYLISSYYLVNLTFFALFWLLINC